MMMRITSALSTLIGSPFWQAHLVYALGIILLMTIATRNTISGSFSVASVRGARFAVSSAPEGGWTWFNSPEAIKVDDRIFTGWHTGDGHPMAAHYDLATRTLSTPQRLYPAGVFEIDDHDNPAFLRRASDGRILAFFSLHTANGTYVNVSTNVGSAAAWNGPTNISSQIGGTRRTYVCPVQFSDGRIRLYFREHDLSDNPSWRYSDSTDGGVTWSSRTTMVLDSGKLTYTQPVQTGDRIDFVASGHPSFDSPASIRHFYYDYSGNTYHKTDGSSAGSLPLDSTDMTLVYDGTTTKSWLWDIAISPVTGYPVIAYVTFPGNDGSAHRYHRADWNGSAWSSTTIAGDDGYFPTDLGIDAGQAFYSGGIAIDRADTDITYIAREDGADWQIIRYPGDVELTSGTGKRVRPIPIFGGSGILAMEGTYTDYLDFDVGTIKAGG